jgi:hypothetical protein
MWELLRNAVLLLRSSLVIKYREEKKPKGGAERCPNR